METRIRDLEDQIERLPRRWEEIKRESARLDSRARAAVGRIRKELAAGGLADERADALAQELGVGDGEGSEQGELLALRTEVAPVPQQAAPVIDAGEDWETLARAVKFGNA